MLRGYQPKCWERLKASIDSNFLMKKMCASRNTLDITQLHFYDKPKSLAKRRKLGLYFNVSHRGGHRNMSYIEVGLGSLFCRPTMVDTIEKIISQQNPT